MRNDLLGISSETASSCETLLENDDEGVVSEVTRAADVEMSLRSLNG